MIKINGKFTEKKQINLVEYLKENGYKKEFIAVELNGKILPKSLYENTVLNDGDMVEIVSFVGGG